MPNEWDTRFPDLPGDAIVPRGATPTTTNTNQERSPAQLPYRSAQERALLLQRTGSGLVVGKTALGIPDTGDDGITTSVMPGYAWRAAAPPPEHWPQVFGAVWTGESFDDPTSGYGRAQKLADNSLSDAGWGQDIVHLSDIDSIKVRLTTASGSGGQCVITLQNDLIKEKICHITLNDFL